MNYIAPPNIAGVTDLVDLTFSAPSIADFSSAQDGDGAMAFAPVANLAPSALAGATMIYDELMTNHYSDGVASNFFDFPGSAFYTYTQFSPVAGLLQSREVSPNLGERDSIVLMFQTLQSGSYFDAAYYPVSDTFYPIDGNEPGPYLSVGTFTSDRKSSRPELAPAYLAGMNAHFSPENQIPYTFSFGPATLAAVPSNARGANGVANYVYARTGGNTAQLTFTYLAPAAQTNASGALNLFFTASRAGIYFNTNGYEAGSFALVATPQTAPGWLTGKSVILNSEGATATIAFGQGGFTYSFPSEPGGSMSGPYTAWQASAQVDMITLDFPGIGNVGSLELIFATPTTGSALFTSMDYYTPNASLVRFTVK